jgi:4-amino-4-deoxy-L-arabinose transferase-like glycosyltransferase
LGRRLETGLALWQKHAGMTVGAIGKEATASTWRAALRSPLTWIVAAVLLLHAIGIAWGLPASDGWDDDGIAPRDFLVGVAETYWPGHYFTYPPVHLLLLTVLTLPVSLVALVRAHSFAPADLVAEFIRVPYMTAFALIARCVTLLMSIGIVLSLASFAAEVRGKKAGYWVAAVCGVNVVFTYYAHTTNLDVPYFFWACLSLLALARAMARQRPRLLRWALVLAALAVGTKDQAYALFVFSVPLALVLWVTTDPFARSHRREVARELGIGIAMAAALLLSVDGAITNPMGFAERLRFLAGPASQDHTSYPATAAGMLLVLRDCAAHWGRYYPVVLAPFAVAGAAAAFARRGASGAPGRTAEALPLWFALSFTLAFTLVARRTEHRFLLPQMLLMSVYAGLALEWLFESMPRRATRIAWAIAAAVFGIAVFDCLTVDAALVLDPRYDAEHWLASHIAPGDVIETYGNNVYLPRFPAGAHVTRVGPEAVEKRNPLPGVDEVRDDYAGIDRRRPRFIVVPRAWVWRYVVDEDLGRALGNTSPWLAGMQKDTAACQFFRDLHDGRRGYRLAHLSQWHSDFWPRYEIHASTALDVRIFEPDDAPSAEAATTANAVHMK